MYNPFRLQNDQLMTVKEAIKFVISFGGHTFEIIAYLLPFSTAFNFIFGLKTMTEIEKRVIIPSWNSRFEKINWYYTIKGH